MFVKDYVLWVEDHKTIEYFFEVTRHPRETSKKFETTHVMIVEPNKCLVIIEFKRWLLAPSKPIKEYMVNDALVLAYFEIFQVTMVLISCLIKIEEIKGLCDTSP